MFRRIAISTLLGAAATATLVAGTVPASALSPSVQLAAVSTPLADGPHGHGPGGHDGHGPGDNHGGRPDFHPGPVFHRGPVFHYPDGHDRGRPGWHYYGGWGWWPGVVSADQCRDHHGHVDWRWHRCLGGRYDGFRVR